jgi:hypothetical protein
LSGRINTANLNITSLSGLLNTANLNILSLSGRINNLNITSLSGGLNTANLNITSLSGLLNTANLNITSLSGLLNTANLNITSISGRLNTTNSNITTLQGQMTTANSNITTLQGQMTTANSNITTLQGQMTTANTNISTISGRVNTINSAATYSAASIIANGFVQATDFRLTNRTNIIYQSTIAGLPANYSFPSGTAKTIVVNNVPAGLYIMCISLYINNGSGTTTANFTNLLYSLNSSDGLSYFIDNDYHAFTLPTSRSTNFSKMCMINNPGTYNFTLSITPTYTNTPTLTWMSSGGLAPSQKTYLQFIKIG